MRLPGGDLAARLAERLLEIGYTVEGVRERLGTVAADALDREESTPASRALSGDDSPLGATIRLLLLRDEVDAEAVRRGLGVDPEALGDLTEVRLGSVSAAVELAPYAADDHDWFVASDWSTRRTGRPATADHVLGVGGASTMLAQCTVRPQVDSTLDVGTGCGVQAFHLSGHSRRVVGTDVSGRCLGLAAFNAGMNRIAVDLREGCLFAPVAGERFDLIVSNPPFVIGSPGGARHDYRDGGLHGDEVCATLVRGASEHLTEGGWCQLLANWEIVDGVDWAARPRSWVQTSGLDAWVIQRDVQDPAEYVEMWLRDAGEQWAPRYPKLYDEWLRGLETRGVLGVGFGLITLRRSGRPEPVQRYQHAAQQWQQPVAPDVERWFAAHDLLAAGPGEVLAVSLLTAPDVVVEERRTVDAEETVTSVVRTAGMAWSGTLDPFGVAVLAGLDGLRPAGDVVAEVAVRHGLEVDQALAAAVPVLGRLLAEGFVRPAG